MLLLKCLRDMLVRLMNDDFQRVGKLQSKLVRLNVFCLVHRIFFIFFNLTLLDLCYIIPYDISLTNHPIDVPCQYLYNDISYKLDLLEL